MSDPLWISPTAVDANGRVRPVEASVQVESSKSLTNRQLVLASLADSNSHINAVLQSRDGKLMTEALQALGARFIPDPENSSDFTVIPLDRKSDQSSHTKYPISIDCGLAGTVMRFVPPIAALCEGSFIFDGDQHARKRPMGPIIEALKALGISIDEPNPGHLPFTVHGTGKVTESKLSIDASASSQFVSGLLLVGAFFKNGLHLKHVGSTLPSIPHIEMTIDTLKQWGITVEKPSETEWVVPPLPTDHYQHVAGQNFRIEQDLSNIGPFLAAAAVTGGKITVPMWPTKTTQVGNHWLDLLKNFGVTITEQSSSDTSQTTYSFSGVGNYSGVDLDLINAGELAPTIAAIALFADSPTRLRGISHLRGHETDRLKAIKTEFQKLGASVIEHEDGLTIKPAALEQKPGDVFSTYNDHRMATAGAIIGLRVPGLKVENIETTQKTMTNFPDLWTHLLDNIHQKVEYE